VKKRQQSAEDPNLWSPERNQRLIALRQQGLSWGEIATAIGVSYWTVVERKRRLPASAFAVSTGASAADAPAQLRTADPLPAGHPLSWGAISDRPYHRDG